MHYNAEPARNPNWFRAIESQTYGNRANGPPCVGVDDFLFSQRLWNCKSLKTPNGKPCDDGYANRIKERTGLCAEAT